jgi:hypothetical protein
MSKKRKKSIPMKDKKVYPYLLAGIGIIPYQHLILSLLGSELAKYPAVKAKS